MRDPITKQEHLSALGLSLGPQLPLLPQSAFLPLEKASQMKDRHSCWSRAPGKTKLAQWVTDEHMPLLKDARSRQEKKAHASVLLSPNRMYLMGSAGEHSGTYGKIRPAVDMESGKTFLVKVVRRVPVLPSTPALTRHGSRQTAFDVHADMLSQREARYMQQYSGLRDFITDDRRHYFVMPHGFTSLDGVLGRLSKHVRSDVARSVGWQMLEQATSLHAASLVHGDLKAGNMLFHSSKGTLQFIDFGLTEPFDPLTNRTKPGVPFGSYPPPSRFRVEHRGTQKRLRTDTPATPADDVWAIGVTILHLLSKPEDWTHDPFYWQNVVNSGPSLFSQWAWDMRQRDTGNPIDLSANNASLRETAFSAVAQLHAYCAKAYDIDPALTLFVVSNLLDPLAHAAARAGDLATHMWSAGLIDADVFVRGTKALVAAAPSPTSSDDENMLNGLMQLRADLLANAPKRKPLPPIPVAA